VSRRYVQLVRLETAEARASPDGEVRASTIEALRPALEDALSGDRASVPDRPAVMLTGARYGPCCVVTVLSSSDGTGGSGASARAPPAPAADTVAVATIGVATHSRCGARLWRSLHDERTGTYATYPARRPAAPWAAVRLETAARDDPEALAGVDVDALAAELAWTWMEIREED